MAAAIETYEAGTLVGDDGRPLPCLYVVVDGRTDPAVGAFLAGWGECCSTCDLDWQAVRRPRSALVGIDLVHTCRDADLAGRHLRLVFDVRRDAEALEHLAATQVLVVGTRPYGAFANLFTACAIDADAVRDAVARAEHSLTRLLAVAVAQ